MKLRVLFGLSGALILAAGGGFVAWESRSGGKAQAPTRIDAINAKLAANGQPTLSANDPRDRANSTTTAAQGAPVPPATSEATSPPPELKCGPPGSAADIVARYGEIRNACLRVGNAWVVTTLGDREGHSGTVAVFDCASEDTACASTGIPGALPGSWTYYAPPRAGGVTVLTFHPPSVLVLANAGDQVCFDVATRAFNVNKPCG